MNYLTLLICFLLTHRLSGQVVHTEDTSKFKVSETFWATENKVYVDSIEMELGKTFLDTNNIKEIIFFKDNHQSLHKNRGATLITRKKRIDFITLVDLLSSLNIGNSTKVKFIVDGDLIEDTSNVRFEPSAIVKIDVLKNATSRVDHGFTKDIQVLITTQWRRDATKN